MKQGDVRVGKQMMYAILDRVSLSPCIEGI